MSAPSSISPGRLVTTRGLTAFRHRNYRLFFVGQAISLVGTWMQQVAQAWLVLELTRDPIWLGITATAQFLPVMLLGLFAGVVADAFPKRRTLLAAQVAMMVLAAILAVITATGIVEVWMILVLAAGLGVANAVDMPVRQAFVVELVGRREVSTAVGLNSAMFNGARIVGPAIAGIIIGALGVAVAFALNALSFMAVIASLLLMRERDLQGVPAFARPRSGREVVTNLREGLHYVRGTPVVLLAMVVVGLVATAGMNFNVLIPDFTTRGLGGDATLFGFLMAGSGLGSMVAALWIAVEGRPHPRRMATGALILGVGSIALVASDVASIAWLLMVVIGFGAILMMATANTTIQLAVPNELRGRVMSVYTTLFSSSMPIGGLIFGGLASAAGPVIAIATGGVLSALVGLGALGWFARRPALSVLSSTGSPVAVPASAGSAASGPAQAPASAPAIGTPVALSERPPVPSARQSPTAPRTSAAFKPPKPNDVVNTRR